MAFFNKMSRLFQIQYLNITCKRLYIPMRVQITPEFKNMWMEKFSNTLTDPSNVSKETWESMRNTMMLNERYRDNVDLLAFVIFDQNKSVDTARSYYKFLEDNNYNISSTTLSMYLSLFRLKETYTDEERAYILNICKKIMNQHKLLPWYIARSIIICLCKIKELEKAIMLLKEFESDDSTVLKHAYYAIINCCVENGNLTMALKYFEIMMQRRANIESQVYNAYLKQCLWETNTCNENIEKIFLLWKKYGIKPPIDIATEFMDVCNEVGWSVKFTTISNLQCNTCHETIEETKLSEEDFERLHEVIVKNVITNDVYKTSDPTELEVFKKFIAKHKPYDFVIDGLNVVYTNITCKKQFATLLRNLQQKQKKVLVIARKHMKKTFMKLGSIGTADFFFVDDLSKDDAFILYATFSSGNDANMVSKDLMRQHKFTFYNPELEVLFKKWQLMHQYNFSPNTNTLRKILTYMPIDSFVSKKNNYWHIPCHPKHTEHVEQQHRCNTWLCCKMPN